MIARSVPEIHCTRKNVTEEEDRQTDRGIGYSSSWMEYFSGSMCCYTFSLALKNCYQAMKLSGSMRCMQYVEQMKALLSNTRSHNNTDVYLPSGDGAHPRTQTTLLGQYGCSTFIRNLPQLI